MLSLSLSYVLSPYNPPKDKTGTWDMDYKNFFIMDMDNDKDYQDFWARYKPDEIRFPNRKRATYRLWSNRIPATKKAMLAYVTENSVPKWKNPYFFVQEFADPKPDFLRGDETDADIVQVRYNGLFKLCTRETMNLFGLEYVRDWKK